MQALAAVLGGAQSLHTNSRDEALALPTAEAARLALRTQQFLAYERCDRNAGSAGRQLLRRVLTNGLEAAANDYLAEIDALGGPLAAIEAGYQQRQIQESAYQVQRAVETEPRLSLG